VTSLLDRQAPCPSCGATITFQFAGAKAIVCKYCKALVVRTDRALAMVGRVADLLEIASPFTLHATGKWGGKRFEVEGRVQVDRAGAPGAPWQEFFIGFPETGEWCWIASAQGRFYSTVEVKPTPPLPPPGSLRPGAPLQIQGQGALTVVEVGKRRVVSAEGQLPNVALPGVATWFADIAGPNGVFGTIDYGSDDPQAPIPPALYIGTQFDPAGFQLDSGQPLEQPQAKVAEAQCPTCGGSLPIVAPGTAERVVCRYCGTVSDIKQGGRLEALAQAPKPPMEPYIPIGAQGTLRGKQSICVGFVIRGCTVEGDRYHWREYLLYGGPSAGYAWLMEEDGAWKFVVPINAGDVREANNTVDYRGQYYRFKQSVSASVEAVVGEFYWRVEVGETVQATDYEGSGGIVSVERAETEVTHSLCTPISDGEIALAFNLSPPVQAYHYQGGDYAPPQAKRISPAVVWVIIILVIILVVLASECDGGGGSGSYSSGSNTHYVGPSFGGK